MPNTAAEQPIFVAGPDRSGTSLIYALLSSHPNISMVRRTNMFRYFYAQFGDLSRPENLEHCLNMMLRYKRLKHLDPDPERIRTEFLQGEPSYGRLFALFHRHNAERRGKQRWGDKSLHTERYADQLFTEFPNARVIHMVRDPRDRYASVKKRYNRNRGRVGAAMGRWLSSLHMARRNLERYPGRYRILTYESLAQQPEVTLREICDFIGEAYSPDMLSMQGAPDHRDKGGNSSFVKFEPGTISTASIGRYQKVLSREDIAFVQAVGGDEMVELGYALDTVSLSLGEQVSYRISAWPVNLGRMWAWMAMEGLRDRRGRRLPAYRILPEPVANHV